MKEEMEESINEYQEEEKNAYMEMEEMEVDTEEMEE